MLNNKQEILKKGVLAFGLIFFFYAVYLDRFESSLIIVFTALISWMAISLIWNTDRNYKQIGNTLMGAGLIISISIFFNFGIEPTAIPVGGFVFQNDGIYKAISLLFLFIVSGFLFRYLNELVPDNPSEPLKDTEEEEQVQPFESEDWDFVSEDEILSGEYEIIKD